MIIFNVLATFPVIASLGVETSQFPIASVRSKCIGSYIGLNLVYSPKQPGSAMRGSLNRLYSDLIYYLWVSLRGVSVEFRLWRQ
jgi:hypothetical protein